MQVLQIQNRMVVRIVYEIIFALCAERGITVAEMCRGAGIPQSTMTELKKGRTRTLSMKNAAKVAAFFGVPVESLLGGAAPAPAPEPLVNDDPELTAYLEVLRSRPECRMLFSLTRDATKADVEKAVAIIEALRRTGGEG